MRIIDRYIIAKFVKSFLFTVFLFTLVATAVDFSEKLDNFIEKSIPANEVIMDYYIHFIPHIAVLLAPLFLLISIVYFTSKLAYRNEFITSVSGGISFYRLLLPYLLGACFFASGLYVINHKILRDPTNLVSILKKDDSGIKRLTFSMICIVSLIRTRQCISNNGMPTTSAVAFSIERFQNHRLVWKLSSTKATLVKDINEKEGQWRIQNYLIRSREKMVMSMRRASFKEPYLDTILPITEKTFVALPSTRETMTTKQLRDYIKVVKSSGAGGESYWAYEMHRRSASAFSMIIMTLIGFSIASRKVRGGIGLHLAGAVVVAVAYVFFNKFSETWTMGYALNPMLGAWLPNIFFACMAIFMIWRAQK